MDIRQSRTGRRSGAGGQKSSQDRCTAQESVPASAHRHRLPAGYRVAKTSVLSGLHHEYRLVKEAA
jgi:hypothetical protein